MHTNMRSVVNKKTTQQTFFFFFFGIHKYISTCKVVCHYIIPFSYAHSSTSSSILFSLAHSLPPLPLQNSLDKSILTFVLSSLKPLLPLDPLTYKLRLFYFYVYFYISLYVKQ